MRFTIATSIFIPLLLSASILAAEPRRTARSSTPYGMAGCGLGSVLIANKGKWPQLGASILNTISSNQTSAISSGTSRCVHGAQYAQVEQRVYISVNLNSLIKEAAQGQGLHLEGLAQLMGCDQSEGMQAFAQFSKVHYNRIFDSTRPEKVLSNYRKLIKIDRQLTLKCLVLG